MNKSELDRRIELAVDQYKFLNHEGIGLTEVRALPEGKVTFYEHEGSFRTGMESLIRSHEFGLYVGIAPRSRPSGTRADIEALTSLVLDLDPVDSSNDPGNSALCLARALQYGEGSYVVSSGSGAHVFYSINPIAATTEAEQAYKAWGLYHQGKLSDSHVKVDSIFDLPRIIRLWGSKNAKSGRTCTPVHLNCAARFNFRPTDYISPTLKGTTGVSGDRSNRPQPGVNAAVNNGSRNTTLASLAGVMRRRGMSETSIKEALLSENRERCVPPLPENEVVRIASSVSRYAPQEPVNIKSENNGLVKSLGDDYFASVLTRKAGISSGFKRLDDTLAGWKRGQVAVIGARPNEGKTTLMVQLMESFCKQGLKGLYFPTELGAEPIYDKILSRVLQIPLKKFQTGEFTDQEKEKIRVAKEGLKNLDLQVVEDFGLTTEKLVKYVEEIKPDVIAVDYIQALSYTESSPQEIGRAVRAIREVSAKVNTITLIGSQLNRPSSDDRTNLGRLKGSGSIEELADIVMCLTNIDRTDYPIKIDLSVIKSRYSSLDNIPMKLWSTYAKFEEYGVI